MNSFLFFTAVKLNPRNKQLLKDFK